MAQRNLAWETCQWSERLQDEWTTVVANGTATVQTLVSAASVESLEGEDFLVERIVGSMYFRAATAAGGASATAIPVKVRITLGLETSVLGVATGALPLTDARDEFLWERLYIAQPGATTALGRATALIAQAGPTVHPWRYQIDIKNKRRIRPTEALFITYQVPADFPNPTDLVFPYGWLRVLRKAR